MRGSRFRKFLLLFFGPLLVGAVLLLLPVLPPVVMTQHTVPSSQDSVLVAAGTRYQANGIQRFFIGSHYRDLWSQPIKVEVLKLHQFEGGLRPIKEGGGQETRSLHFLSGTGHRYIFRSTDKELVRLIHAGLSGSMLARVIQDQTSASHPASALVTAPLQEALGLPTAHPRLVLIPSDDSLGAYQARFAGLLGTFQEAPVELGNWDVRDTDEVLPLLNQGGRNQVDAPAFLTARLLDLLVNDWDRHGGQWRWMGSPQPWGTRWKPIPVDRDQAFARYDGLLLAIARLRTTKLSAFGPEYPHLQGLTRNSGWLDRRFLAGLSREVWDSVIGFVTERLTDAVIDAAVHRMPEPYWRLSGPPIAEALKQRRAGLRVIADEFYERLAQHPEIHLAANGERLRLEYRADGSLELAILSDSSGTASPLMLRRFLPDETSRIELIAHGSLPPVSRTGIPNRGGIAVRVVDTLGKVMRDSDQ